jgi:hypothetical protein
VITSMDSPFLFRAAGYSAVLALVALIGAGVTIALFFGGAGAFWGPINDVLTAIALAALILPVLAVDRLAGSTALPWIRIVTVAAVAGLTLAAVGQMLLVVGVIDLETSFITGGLGILPFFAWLIALAVLAFGPALLPASVGWLVVGVIALTIGVSVVAMITIGPLLWIVSVALLVALAGWLGSLAADLLARATA